jgi:hypothetical protein
VNPPTLDLVDDDALVVSPSGLDTLRTCPRMWWYRYGWKRVSGGVAPARDGGKAFDAALNLRYARLGAQAVDPATEEAMLAEIDRAYTGLELPLDEYRTPARYKDVVRAYNEHYGQEPWRVLGVQVPFVVPLGEVATPPVHVVGATRLPARVQVHLHGILDLLVAHQNGQTLVVDTKTMKQWGPSKAAEYENHAQMKAYAWAVPRLSAQAQALGFSEAQVAKLPDAVHGCLLNAVVVRPPYKSEAWAGKANAKPRTEFHRTITTYSQERLEEWRQDTLAWVGMALGWVASGHFPQNERACANHYGAKCPYLDVCTAPPGAQREVTLGSDLFVDYQRGGAAREVGGVGGVDVVQGKETSV